jgi:transcriptional regulator with XRE-family HTH domain
MPNISEVLAENLRRLLAAGPRHNLPGSQATLAKRAGVAQTTLSNWLDPSRGRAPQLDKLERVAAVYGLEVWQLLVPGLPDDLVLDRHLRRLVAAYRDIANADVRNRIWRIAEAEADYARHQAAMTE